MVTPPISPAPKPNGSERRRFPRYNVALDVAFGPVSDLSEHPDEQRLKRTVTVDLSVGGLCLHSDLLYPINSHLFCSLSLPNRDQPVIVVGTVAWFQRTDQRTHEYKLGVEFTRISTGDRRAIEALLERPPTAGASRAKKLLLVDDDPELQLSLKFRFESVGFQVITANEGLEALRKGREEFPHLIILDVMLPNLNGYEVCRLLKFDQKFHHIPILLFTARSRREDLQLGYAMGADACLTKPCDGKALIAKVEELLAAKRK